MSSNKSSQIDSVDKKNSDDEKVYFHELDEVMEQDVEKETENSAVNSIVAQRMSLGLAVITGTKQTDINGSSILQSNDKHNSSKHEVEEKITELDEENATNRALEKYKDSFGNSIDTVPATEVKFDQDEVPSQEQFESSEQDELRLAKRRSQLNCSVSKSYDLKRDSPRESVRQEKEQVNQSNHKNNMTFNMGVVTEENPLGLSQSNSVGVSEQIKKVNPNDKISS